MATLKLFTPDEYAQMQKFGQTKPGHLYEEKQDADSGATWIVERPAGKDEPAPYSEIIPAAIEAGAADTVKAAGGSIEGIAAPVLGRYMPPLGQYAPEAQEPPSFGQDPTLGTFEQALADPYATAREAVYSSVRSAVPTGIVTAGALALGATSPLAITGAVAAGVTGGLGYTDARRDAYQNAMTTDKFSPEVKALFKAVPDVMIEMATELPGMTAITKAAKGGGIKQIAKNLMAAWLSDVPGEAVAGALQSVNQSIYDQQISQIEKPEDMQTIAWRAASDAFKGALSAAVPAQQLGQGAVVGIANRRQRAQAEKALDAIVRGKTADEVIDGMIKADPELSAAVDAKMQEVLDAGGTAEEARAEARRAPLAEIVSKQIDMVEADPKRVADEVLKDLGVEKPAPATSAPVAAPGELVVPPDGGMGAATPSPVRPVATAPQTAITPQAVPVEATIPAAPTPAPVAVQAPVTPMPVVVPDPTLDEAPDDAEVDAMVAKAQAGQAKVVEVVKAAKKPRVSKAKKQAVVAQVLAAPPEQQREVVESHIPEAQKTPNAPLSEADKSSVDVVLGRKTDPSDIAVAAAEVAAEESPAVKRVRAKIEQRNNNKFSTASILGRSTPAAPPAPNVAQNVAAVRQVLEPTLRIIARHLGRAGVVKIVDDPSQLPERIQAFRNRINKSGGLDFQAFYDPSDNTVTFVTSNMRPQDASGVALHELAVHFGLRQIVGRDAASWNIFIDSILDVLPKDQVVKIQKEEFGSDYVEGDVSQMRYAAEEVIAQTATRLGNGEIKPPSFWQKVVDLFRAFMRETFGTQFMMNESDILKLVRDGMMGLRRADMRAERGLAGETGADGGIYGSTTRATDRYPKAGGVVDGRKVRPSIPNIGSIGASFNRYEVLPGIREVMLSEFEAPPEVTERTKRLAAEISEYGEINPLIVAIDADGPYILEGGHRYDALKILGAKSFPAKVVIDQDSAQGIIGSTTRRNPAPDPEQPKGFWSRLTGVDTSTDHAETILRLKESLKSEIDPILQKRLDERLANKPDTQPDKGRLSGRGTRSFGAFGTRQDVKDLWAQQTLILQNSGDPQFSEPFSEEKMQEEVKEYSEKYGLNPQDLMKALARQDPSPMRRRATLAAAFLKIDALTTNFYDLQEEARKAPTTENLVASELALSDLQAMMQAVQGVTTGASDSMNVARMHRKMQALRPGAQKTAYLNKILEALGGLDTIQKKNSLARLAAAKQMSTGELLSFLKDIQPATTTEKLLEAYRMNLLGIGSQLTNVGSNLAFFAYDQFLKQPLADIISGKSPVAGIGARTRALIKFRRDAMSLAQIGASLRYAYDVMTEKEAVDAGTHEAVEAGRKLKGRVGTAVRWSGNALGLMDTAFKSLWEHQELYTAAERKAKGEGLTGQAYADAVDKYYADPDLKTLERVAFKRKEGTFQLGGKDLDAVSKGLLAGATGLSQALPASGFILPYKRTPANLFSMMLTGTPFGLIRAYGQFAEAAQTGDENMKRRAAETTAHALLGTTAMGIGALLASMGLLIPTNAKDEEERKVFDAMGGRGALKLPFDFNFDLNRADPMGSLMILGANVYHGLRTSQMDGDAAVGQIGNALRAMATTGIQESFVYSLKQFADMLGGEGKTEERLYKFGRNMLYHTVMPMARLVSDVAAIGSPNVPETGRQIGSEGIGRATEDYIAAQIPGARSAIPPEFSPLGEPLSKSPFLGVFPSISPASIDKRDKSPVFDGLAQLGALPRSIEFSQKYADYNLTANELVRYNQYRRDLFELRLPAVLRSAARPEMKRKLAERVINFIDKQTKRRIEQDRKAQGRPVPRIVPGQEPVKPSSAILWKD